MAINYRSKRAAKALRAWRGRYPRDEADFRDLLTDLMHYATQAKIDFEHELGIARRGFDHESGVKDYVSCGICGAYHPRGFTGDCRDDKNRRATP